MTDWSDDNGKLTDPSLLAQIDQVCAGYREHTGHPVTALTFDGWRYDLCDLGHWHRTYPVDE